MHPFHLIPVAFNFTSTNLTFSKILIFLLRKTEVDKIRVQINLNFFDPRTHNMCVRVC